MNFILNIQNNSYPYLFIDKIWDIVPLTKAKGKKCFTSNEWFFDKESCYNFVPNYIVLECLVQIVVITVQSDINYSKRELNDIRFKEINFFDSIESGDELFVECIVIKIVRGIIYAESKGFKKNVLICSMKIEIAILDDFNKFLPIKKV